MWRRDKGIINGSLFSVENVSMQKCPFRETKYFPFFYNNFLCSLSHYVSKPNVTSDQFSRLYNDLHDDQNALYRFLKQKYIVVSKWLSYYVYLVIKSWSATRPQWLVSMTVDGHKGTTPHHNSHFLISVSAHEPSDPE